MGSVGEVMNNVINDNVNLIFVTCDLLQTKGVYKMDEKKENLTF